ncbi:MAG TPA: inorganic pyrophosphatase [Microlunatus sp.]
MLQPEEVTRLTSLSIFDQLDELVTSSKIIIDRPKGSAHPRFGQWVYPVDYGYIAGTSAADGEGIDIWLGTEPDGPGVTGILCCYDAGNRDAELKVLWRCDDHECRLIEDFYAEQPQAALLVRRPAPQRRVVG